MSNRIDKLFDTLQDPNTKSWSAGVAFDRSNPLPLDKWSVFETYTEALTYAETNGKAYPGQYLAVLTGAGQPVDLYVISDTGVATTDAEGNATTKLGLQPIGGTDGLVITTDNNGNLTLNGFESATVGKYPRVATREVSEGADKIVEKYIEWVDLEIPDVSLDEVSIDRIPEGQEGAGDIEIKGFANADVNGLIPQIKIEGAGESRTKTLEWVSVQEAIAGIEDKDTVTGVKAGNDGVIVEKLATPDSGDDRTYTVAHKEAPTTGDAANAPATGTQGTYITDVLVDEFGHVASVKTAADKDTIYDITPGYRHEDANNGGSLVLTEDGEEKRPVYIHGYNGIYVTVGADVDKNPIISIEAPDIKVHLEEDEAYKNAEVKPDTVAALVSLDRKTLTEEEQEQSDNLWKHHLEATYVDVPTKEYVDRVVSGATDYLGTISDIKELDIIKAKRGDFLRVAQEIKDHEEVVYHASDMLICETASIEDDKGNVTTPATWSVIHGEIDANTWVANTKDADGYVAKTAYTETVEGETTTKYHTNAFWKADSEGNPGWVEMTPVTRITTQGDKESPYIQLLDSVSEETGEKSYTLKVTNLVNSLEKGETALQGIVFDSLANPIDTGSGDEVGNNSDLGYTTAGFTVTVQDSETTDEAFTFELETTPADGIVFYPNFGDTSVCGEEKARSKATVSLAPWAKNRITESISEVTTTVGGGLKTATTYTYTDGSGEDVAVDSTDKIPSDVLDYTKTTTIDIDETTTFILNCGTAADLPE